MKRSLTDLPQELQLEILVRLPLKALCVSKCVCRSFNNLIALNNYFIRFHSSNAPQSLAFQFEGKLRLSRRIRMLEPELLKFKFTPIFQEPSVDHDVENRFLLVNSCNGLLYFCRRLTPELDSIVCNPVVNEYVKIHSEASPDSNSVLTSSWLGFDSNINEYKLLLIFSSKTGKSMGMNSYVFHLRSHSGRDVENTPLGSDHSWNSSSTVVNGVIHWFDSSQKDIVLFDFEKEKFGKVALPLEEQLGDKNCMSIGVLEGCLALSCNHISANRVDIWVMEKLGNRDIWRKRFIVDTVTPERRKTRRMHTGQFKPLQVLRNGKLLMLWGRRDLACYDQKNVRFRLVGFRGMNANCVVVFTPTFVSLKDTLGIDSVMQCKRPFISLKDPLSPRQLLALQVVAVVPSRRIHIFESRIWGPEFRPTFEVPSEIEGSSGVNRFSLVNSCNGVLYFCVKHRADVYSLMCNPVTHENVRIYLEDSLVPRSQWLGFDLSINRYKVLMVLISSRDDPKGLDSYVLELPSGSSRYIENTPLGSDHSWDASTTFVNGVIHWFDSSQEAIVLFDFVKEMFGEVALPPEEQLGNKECMSIGVLNGCLALSHNDISKHCINIWVRETHENQQCWEKEYAVHTESLERYKPLQILRDGELLILLSNKDLAFCDPENMSSRVVWTGQDIHCAFVVFTPSFVYLKDTVGFNRVMVQHVRPRDGSEEVVAHLESKELEDAK